MNYRDFDLGEELHSRISGEFLDRNCLKVIDKTLIQEDEDEQLVLQNDPSHSFVQIEEIADIFDYPEVFNLTQEEEDKLVLSNEKTFQKNTFIDPVLIEDEKHFGRIICAFTDAETGCIILMRENDCSVIASNYREAEIHTDDEYENFYPRVRGRKMLLDSEPISAYDEKIRTRAHQNLKTFSDRKIQRMNRKKLRSIIGKN